MKPGEPRVGEFITRAALCLPYLADIITEQKSRQRELSSFSGIGSLCFSLFFPRRRDGDLGVWADLHQ